MPTTISTRPATSVGLSLPCTRQAMRSPRQPRGRVLHHCRATWQRRTADAAVHRRIRTPSGTAVNGHCTFTSAQNVAGIDAMVLARHGDPARGVLPGRPRIPARKRPAAVAVVNGSRGPACRQPRARDAAVWPRSAGQPAERGPLRGGRDAARCPVSGAEITCPRHGEPCAPWIHTIAVHPLGQPTWIRSTITNDSGWQSTCKG